jgi:predicted AAA+ superfamily ATPase
LIFNLEGVLNSKLYYWRESGKGSEVDIVITPFSGILPIEVKYQESIGNSDLDGLRKFNRKFNSSISLIVTKKELGFSNSIIKMPAWLYLIMC